MTQHSINWGRLWRILGVVAAVLIVLFVVLVLVSSTGTHSAG